MLRAGIAIAIMGVVGLLVGCSDNPGGPNLVGVPEPEGLIVSDPVAAPNVAAGTGTALALAATAEDPVVYVSLAPGTIPTGSTATIRRVGDAATLTTPVLDGGFDPVPVAAEVGDSIEVLVTDAGGLTIEALRLAIAARRPPIIVRTDPPRRKTDVPLNSVMVFVFSEPVAAGTLTSSSVQLFRGTTPVPGTVSLLQGTATTAVFEPSEPLNTNTDYRLVVTEAVRDLEGDALESDVAVEFTTGTIVLGAVASVAVLPGDSGVVVPIGSRFQMTAIPRDAQGNVLPGRPVVWSSTDPSVATVSATGLVTAVAVGAATILADVEGVRGQARVSVRAALSALASVTVTPEAARVDVGATTYFAAEVRDTAGWITSRRAVTWSSSEPAVATVIPLGSNFAQATGVADGVARIVATVEGISDTVFITVGPPPPSVGFVLSPDTVTVVLRASAQLTGVSRDATGAPTPIEASQVVWTSSDPTVLSVGSTGLVTGVGAGSATITATWSGYSATARVTVMQLDFTTLSAGYSHTCGLVTNGAAYCWGGNDDGTVGQPGIIQDGSSEPQTIKVRAPVPVADGLTFVAVSSGHDHTCALSAVGAGYCWGANRVGQLGDGTVTNTWRPVAAAGGLRFVVLNAGGGYTCGLTATGVAYCWGANDRGQLGDGTMIGSPTPLPVAGGLTFTSLSVGFLHTCGLTPDGVAYCWGENGDGQLGDATTIDHPTPVPVAGGLTFTALSLGFFHTCGLTPGGVAYCWGDGASGQLGNGTLTTSAIPLPVAGGLSFVAVSAGVEHSCGVTSGGVAYCWGRNHAGALGIGLVDFELYPSPQRVVGEIAFATLSAYSDHTCAATAARVMYCWGLNRDGQLGVDALDTDPGTPGKVLGQP
jgi:alpha-tubulin suppressor-like RCC1 family protein